MRIVVLENLGCAPKLAQDFAARLKAQGHELEFYERSADLASLKERVRGADALILANMPLPAEVLASADKLKFIDVAFTGVDHVPMNDARARGIQVANASGYADEAVAELCISFMIQLLRQIPEADAATRKGGTKAGLSARLIEGKTVGIVGAGAIGRRLAALCKAFGARVIAYSRRPVSDPNIDANVSLEQLLKEADIVSLHTPLTPETRGMIGREQLEKMKPTAILLNTGRGPVVDNAALAKALNDGLIAGAAIDVFDQEPPLPPDYPLLNSRNTLLTPHLGFYSEESLDKRAKIAFANLEAWLSGKPQNLV